MIKRARIRADLVGDITGGKIGLESRSKQGRILLQDPSKGQG